MSVPYRHFLGYDKGPDGNLAVNREQARTVKLIYRLFLDGYTFHSEGVSNGAAANHQNANQAI
nr:hypothetical protein [uncultured Dialister sp.]